MSGVGIDVAGRTCGESEQDLLNGTVLALGARLDPVDAGGAGYVAVTVTLTNTTPAALRGMTGPPELVVVAGGRVVAESGGVRQVGLLVDLAPGASMTLPASLPLLDCDRPAASLAPGDYRVYAFTSLVADEGGERQILSGGPWPLTVR